MKKLAIIITSLLFFTAPALAPSVEDKIGIAASSGPSSGVLVTVLPAAAGRITFITGFDITATSPPNFPESAVVSITGLVNTLTYICQSQPLEATLLAGSVAFSNVVPLSIRFPNPLPFSAPGRAITLTLTGFQHTSAAVVMYGFQVRASPDLKGQPQ
ncbi:MAG: hypothetical protein WA624_19455 [Methylocella sp.]